MRWLTLSLEAQYRSPGPLASQYTGKKCGNIGWNMKQVHFEIWWKVFFKTWYSTTQKKELKLLTDMYHKSYSSPEPRGKVINRSWLCFCPSQTCVSLVDWCARIRVNAGISLLACQKSGRGHGPPTPPSEPRLWGYHCSATYVTRNWKVIMRISHLLLHNKISQGNDNATQNESEWKFQWRKRRTVLLSQSE